jgi:streptomycin 6-kinase
MSRYYQSLFALPTGSESESLWVARSRDGRMLTFKQLRPREATCVDDIEAALRAWAGRKQTVQLYQRHDNLLVYSYAYGRPLCDGPEAAQMATAVAATVCHLHSQPAPPVRPLSWWIHYRNRRYLKASLPMHWQQALRRLSEIICSHSENYLLHGDLLAGNVIHAPASGQLTLIDPRGLRGLRAHDLARYATYCCPHPRAVYQRMLAAYQQPLPLSEECFAYCLLTHVAAAQSRSSVTLWEGQESEAERIATRWAGDESRLR